MGDILAAKQAAGKMLFQAHACAQRLSPVLPPQWLNSGAVSMPKNAYAKRLDAARAAREYAIRRITRQQMLDFVTIALGRMGYGEKRLKDFEQTLSVVYMEFAKAFSDDLKDDKECVYTKECLDRELQRYCGNSFAPYDKRYFDE